MLSSYRSAIAKESFLLPLTSCVQQTVKTVFSHLWEVFDPIPTLTGAPLHVEWGHFPVCPRAEDPLLFLTRASFCCRWFSISLPVVFYFFTCLASVPVVPPRVYSSYWAVWHLSFPPLLVYPHWGLGTSVPSRVKWSALLCIVAPAVPYPPSLPILTGRPIRTPRGCTRPTG